MRGSGWLGVVILALAVGIPASLTLSARFSLDPQRRHAARTAALPLLTARPADGWIRVPARGLEFRAHVAGFAGSGPGLILLHGFPETSDMWRPLIEASAAAGFRVVAFDQRGYSPGARLPGTDAYQIPELVADLLAVADAVGFERFHLVGHDWGSVVGWRAAGRAPERIITWTALSVPHPAAIASTGEGPPLYARVFRIPGLVETLFAAGDFAALRHLVWRGVPEPLMDDYLAVFSEPGALAATLGWYRAMPDTLPDPASLRSVLPQPVLYIWGNRDVERFVKPEVQARLPEFVAGPFESIELDAGHWLIQERPEVVIDATLRHLETYRSRSDG